MNPQDSNFHTPPNPQPELTICIDLPDDSTRKSKPKSLSKQNKPEWLENFQQRNRFFKPKRVFFKLNYSKKIKTYEESVKTIYKFHRFCLENNKVYPTINFTPNVVWWIISALYFSRAAYVFDGKMPEKLFEDVSNELNSIEIQPRIPFKSKENANFSIEDEILLAKLKRIQTNDFNCIIETFQSELFALQMKNQEKLNEIKIKLKEDYNKFQPILSFLNKNPYNILIDLDNNSKKEIEFLDYLESKQHDPKGFTLESLRRPSNLDLEASDVVCQICNDGDFNDDNMIVYCEVIIYFY